MDCRRSQGQTPFAVRANRRKLRSPPRRHLRKPGDRSSPRSLLYLELDRVGHAGVEQVDRFTEPIRRLTRPPLVHCDAHPSVLKCRSSESGVTPSEPVLACAAPPVKDLNVCARSGSVSSTWLSECASLS